MSIDSISLIYCLIVQPSLCRPSLQYSNSAGVCTRHWITLFAKQVLPRLPYPGRRVLASFWFFWSVI